mmetsp:Transcript_33564/g.51618  ORF Transcript_33564/g.51618 Transcript_33564/m.51618 type:complete len:124 (-) Transcript_33564:1121-1492(-)
MKQDLDSGVQLKRTPPSQFSRPFKIEPLDDEESPLQGGISRNIPTVHACKAAPVFPNDSKVKAIRTGPVSKFHSPAPSSFKTAAEISMSTPKFCEESASLIGPRVERTSIIKTTMPAKQQSKI